MSLDYGSHNLGVLAIHPCSSELRTNGFGQGPSSDRTRVGLTCSGDGDLGLGFRV